jgi:hypothetical protein
MKVIFILWKTYNVALKENLKLQVSFTYFVTL